MSSEYYGCNQEQNVVRKILTENTQDHSRFNERFAKQPVYEEESKFEGFEFASSKESSTNSWSQEFASSKEPSTNSWSQEFTTSSSKHKVPKFPKSFEDAFSRISLNNWANEYTTKVESKIPQVPWTGEYMSQTSHVEWIKEFQEQTVTQDNEDKQLKEAALDILNNLNVDQDPKLANSRFVAYLNELVGTSQIPNNNNLNEFGLWKQNFLRDIQPIGETEADIEWRNMTKSWETYESTGYGYKDFAKREFSVYHLSLPYQANPFREVPNKKELLTNASFKDAILMLEAVITENPNDAEAWAKLGELQQSNEIDAQAIAAFLRSTELDPTNVYSWIGLAASCANESCVPDALDAIKRMLEVDPTTQIHANQLTLLNLQTYVGVLDQVVSVTNSRPAILASAILHNLNGSHDRAIELLQSLSTNLKDWSLQNRLAATLANSHRYSDALKIYSNLLTSGYDMPRIYYNQGISLISTDRYEEAINSFIKAIEHQVPIDVVSGVREELVGNYTAPWEALSVAFSLAGRPELTKLIPGRIEAIKSALNNY